MKRLFFISAVLLVVVVNLVAVGQSKDDEIKQLQLLAKENEERAVKAEALAEQYKTEAEQAKEFSAQLRYLAIANAMASKSIELEDKQVGGLVALQAYNFNLSHHGYIYDNQIFNGIFYGLRKYAPIPQHISGHDRPIISIVSNNESGILLSADVDKVIRWTSETKEWKGEQIFNAKDKGKINSIDISADGNLVAVGVNDPSGKKSYVELIDFTKKGNTPKRITGFASPLEKIIFSPDGKSFYSLCNAGRSIMYCDLNASREVIKSNSKIHAMDLSPDGSKIVEINSGGDLSIWNTSDYSVSTFSIDTRAIEITSVAFTPDNKSVVVGDQKGVLRIVDSRTGLTRRELIGHKAQIDEIKFSRSGKIMASISRDQTTRIWNLNDLNKMPLAISTEISIGHLIFTPDANQIMVAPSMLNASNDKVRSFPIQLYPINIEEMAAKLCTLMERNLTKDEWEIFIASDLPYEKTCPNPSDNIR